MTDEIIIAVMHCRFGIEAVNNHVRSGVPAVVTMDIVVFRGCKAVCKHIRENRNLQFINMCRKGVSYSTYVGLCVNMFKGFI
jgi:hypothetical protein